MIVAKRVLLVEGNDDFHVLASLFKHHGVPDAFRLNETGGIDRLLETLPVQLKATAVERVGIVVDADLNIANRWRAIRQILLTAGFSEIPDAPNERGTIIMELSKPKVGIWIMPNNRLPGLVEDFAAFLIPQDDHLSELAHQAIDAIPINRRRFSEAHRSKAHMHTWLAWQADPGTPMGLAITKKYLDANAPTAASFIDWIDRLLIRD
jgi:hypothetical protein